MMKSKIASYISIIFGSICALFALVIIISWYLSFDYIIQIIPNSPPMYYNVALGFLMAGIGIICSSIQPQKTFFHIVAILTSIVVFLIGGLSFIETIYDINFKIDEIFVKVHVSLAKYPFPGRPSLPTSLLFISFGGGILLTRICNNSKLGFFIELFLSFLILIASICTLFGYLIGNSITYTWGSSTYLAINTAFCFMLLGIGILGEVFRYSYQCNIKNERWVPLAVFLCTFFITFMLWISLLIQSKIDNKRVIKEKMAVLGKKIATVLTTHVYHIGDLADQWDIGDDASPKKWKKLVYTYLEKYENNQIVAVAWLDKNNNIRQLEPSSVNKLINSFNVTHWQWQDPFQNTANGKFTTSLALLLAFDQKRLAIWEPIYWEGKLVGSILDLIDIKTLINQIIIKEHFPLGSKINILINGKNVYNVISEISEKNLWLISEKMDIYGSNWEIKLKYPSSIFFNIWHMDLNNTILILGFLFSVLFSLITNFFYISKKKNTELEEVRSLLLKAQKIAKMGSWVWDLKNNKIYCSPETFSILGISSKKNYFTAAEYFGFICSKDDQQFKNTIEELQKMNSSFSTTYTLLRPDKKESIIFLEGDPSMVLNGSPVEITGIIQDITEKKNFERELLQSQKMMTIGQLTGGLAHDFNNLLMIMRGNLELVKEDLLGNSKELRRINVATQAIEHGSDLIKKLLMLSRRQVLHAKKVKFQETIPKFLNFIKPTLGGFVDIIVSLSDEIWPVFIDLSQFENVLLNLAVNARDAMNGSGKLFLDFKNVTINQPLIIGKEKIELGCYVKISVIDTGQGMIPEVLEHIFEPFFTTKEVGKGTGLGLCMVYGFVKQSQGYISIESKVSYGTAVNLYLPRIYLNEGKEIKVEEKNDNVNGHEKILLVEDEEALLEITQEYLEHLGYQILIASNSVEALRIFKLVKNIDLLLTDVIMPGDLTGPKLAIEARRINPQLKVLFVTGYSKNVLAEQNISIESFEILSKPYSMLNLAKIVRKILNNK